MRRNATVVVGLTIVALLPMFAPRAFVSATPPTGLAAVVAYALALLVPCAAAVAAWRLVPAPSGRRKAVLILLFSILAAHLTLLHLRLVDQASYFPGQGNTQWQAEMNDANVTRDPTAIPHSYRFLPDSLVQLFETLTGSFVFSRTVYRVTFGFLLLLAIHRFATIYLSQTGALVVVLLYCLAYPVTIWAYAGQLNDPLSHLSFVVAFLALESGAFVYFLLAVAIGALAKESVVAMLGYYLLFHGPRDRKFWGRFCLAAVVSLAVVVGSRMSVAPGGFSYSKVSGVTLDHITANLAAYPLWVPQLVFSVGIFLPFVVLGWRGAPSTPRRLTAFMLPVLLVSSVLFSWLHEARNYVPVMVPMAVITCGYLAGLWRGQGSATLDPQRKAEDADTA